MTKKNILFLIPLIFLILYGCANIRTKPTVQSIPSLVERKQPLKIGMNLLLDKRPAVDLANTKNLQDVPQDITNKLVEYFAEFAILKEIHSPAKEEDDIVINGEIRRFIWNAYSQPPTYLPIINLYVYLGIPCKTAYGFTYISLELKDNKTGKVISEIDGTSKVAKSYNLYQFRKIESSEELADSFQNAASQLRTKLISAIYKIE